MIIFTNGRTPWMNYQLIARPLPKHGSTQTHNKHIPNIHAFCEIRTHDPGFRANEDSASLGPLGYRDLLHKLCYPLNIIRVIKLRKMTWTERTPHRSIRQDRIVYKILIGEPEGKNSVGRLRDKLEDNIKRI
jgi:hypothetical protein